ncbi:gamma-mobile-trio protein GmtX [Pseudoalteromonas fuliginea]|uniref:gamma-mobile-trio protein GmtX n=1 Tax=Pseudoalteromonas fuliginea TaxID=1872678 RepID=UPI00317447C1
MTPEELLVELKMDVKTKVKQTLQAIYEVCSEQKKRGLSDFSFSTISRLGEGRGVPKAQSIRNKTGAPYRALIKSFEDNINEKNSKNKKYKGKVDWIEEISDVRLKILVSHQAAQLAEAKRIIKEFTPPDMVININDGLAIQTESFDHLERKALEYLMSDDFINKWHFKKGIHGDVLNEQDERVFKIATLDALGKALKNL